MALRKLVLHCGATKVSAVGVPDEVAGYFLKVYRDFDKGRIFCTLYSGADKSLARPDWKNNLKVAILRPKRRSLLPRKPGWTENLLIIFFGGGGGGLQN